MRIPSVPFSGCASISTKPAYKDLWKREDDVVVIRISQCRVQLLSGTGHNSTPKRYFLASYPDRSHYNSYDISSPAHSFAGFCVLSYNKVFCHILPVPTRKPEKLRVGLCIS